MIKYRLNTLRVESYNAPSYTGITWQNKETTIIKGVSFETFLCFNRAGILGGYLPNYKILEGANRRLKITRLQGYK